jgi:peptidylprolyl isomerase
MQNIKWITLSIIVIYIFLSCSSKSDEPVITDSGLKYIDMVLGDGDVPKVGQRVTVHYTGWLEDGKKFDSSYNRNTPLEFSVGVGEMIRGFDEGILSMKKGGKRKLFIPSNLAYGSNGIPGVIPPDATIIFEVELIDIN